MPIHSFPAIFNQAVDQPIVPKMPLWRAVAFAAGLGLSMLSYPVHASSTTGGDTVQGLDWEQPGVESPFHGQPGLERLFRGSGPFLHADRDPARYGGVNTIATGQGQARDFQRVFKAIELFFLNGELDRGVVE